MMVVVVVMVGRDGESVPSTHRTSGRGANVLSFWRVCVTGDLVPQLPEPIRVRALEGMRATWCRVDGEGGGLNGWDCRCGLPGGCRRRGCEGRGVLPNGDACRGSVGRLSRCQIMLAYRLLTTDGCW